MPPHAVLQNGGTSTPRKPITVLVTGFGPFQERYPVNPSWEIASSLPTVLHPESDQMHEIRIIVHPKPIRVAYRETRELIARILEQRQNEIDLVLCMGMASGRKFYTAEHIAHRDGYNKHDDLDNECPTEDEGKRLFPDCPEVLSTSLDFEGLVSRWRSIIAESSEDAIAHGADCRPSEDAGHYLCDYIYFNTLAWFARRNQRMDGGTSKDRPALFFHVPAESDEVSIARGRAVAVALIQAMVEMYTTK